MENQASKLLKSPKDGAIIFSRTAEMRYLGQGYEISVPITDGDFSEFAKGKIQALFDKSYQFLYGRIYPDVKVEFMNLRLNARLPNPPLKIRSLPTNGDISKALKGRRKSFDADSKSFIDYPVYDRYEFFAGATLTGPAIIEEKETTIVMPPSTELIVDSFGTIIISL